MPTLSELVSSAGRSTAPDAEWLHLVAGDMQLLADLAFSDVVLWVPSSDSSFVAVAHNRPSSAATLFYRDFVGQRIKPEWSVLVADAFETARIVDSNAPDWFEETPTRVRAVPVQRRISPSGREVTNVPIAVLTRHTNLSETRSPSRQELTFNDCADELFQMIAAGDFPTSAPRPAPAVAPLAHPTASSASTPTA